MLSYYEVYIKMHGKDYYQKYYLRGYAEQFDTFEDLLAIYVKKSIIDAYFMLELDQEDL